MPRPGHATDYAARRAPKGQRPSRARYAAAAEGQDAVRVGDSHSITDGCNRFFAKRGLRPEPFTFGGADLRRSA